MSFDLTNKNIQDTFQNLLQKTGSDGRLFDLEGNQIDDITLTNVSASGHISASKFIGDGSGLSGLSSAAISTYNNSGDNRIITSVNSSTVQGESNLTFNSDNQLTIGGDVTASGNISSSGIITANNININGASVLTSSPFTATGISESLGTNSTLIRSLTADSISGSLGSNATLIRSLTAAGISGSFTPTSASFSTRVTTNETKLATTETNADVTDTSNVTSAGALMDSELAEITTVKALTAVGISGSFTDASASFSTRLTTEEANVNALQNDSGSFNVRVSALEGDVGQVLTTNSNVTFNNINVGNITSSGNISASGTSHKFGGDILNTTVIQMKNSSSVINTFNTGSHQTCKYLLQVTSASIIQSSELLVMQSSSDAFNTEYAQMNSGLNLVDFSSKVNGENVELIGSSSFISCSIKLNRKLL